MIGNETGIHAIASRIQKHGFICRKCGKCCSDTEEGDALVMVFPDEIHAIMNYTGLAWDDIAQPFPEVITINEKEVTFEWALIREGSRCRFLSDGVCSIYQVRPSICRTYPFMLEGHNLADPSFCNGIGYPISEEDALLLAADLIHRAEAEQQEEEKISSYVRQIQKTPGRRLLIDGEGITSIHG
ncbi:MAG: YkgJ family cysteine cluster protein [Methanospirillaceae archaeon]|nr:YkgJ family cysteine cluster protein [Methanospirillaceae archaeon]